MVATGKASIWSVGQLQMQPIMGKKYQCRKASPKPSRFKKSPRGSIKGPSVRSWPCCAMSVHRRLKRTMSDNMPQNCGLSRLRRWANTVDRLEPLHSMRRWPGCFGT